MEHEADEKVLEGLADDVFEAAVVVLANVRLGEEGLGQQMADQAQNRLLLPFLGGLLVQCLLRRRHLLFFFSLLLGFGLEYEL